MVVFLFFEPSIFKYLKSDKTYLEREPLQIISKKKNNAIRRL